MYIIYQESHYVGEIDTPPEPWIMVGKSRAPNTAAPTLKDNLTAEKPLLLITNTALIGEALKFSPMIWTISQGMV